MWTIHNLKEQGKASFYANRWPLVLVSLIFTIISGEAASDALNVNISDTSGFSIKAGGVTVFSSSYIPYWASTMALIAVIAAVVGILVGIFLLNPLKVGCHRYFLTSMSEKPQMDCLMHNFNEGYQNTVSVMFQYNLRIFLWSLLLIIPGIVKSYEYRLVPYLLAEYPDMPASDALRISSELMYGDKWNSFVLDLSFIGWNILSSITFGLVGLFYANPYQNMTNAWFYRTMCMKQNRGYSSAW